MPAKKFIIPFAATGDKTAVPNTLQPGGTVSYAQGFGPDYELDKTLDPVNAKDVPRDQTNQLYFDLTDAVGEQQLYGVALWGADRAPYPLNARAYHNDKLWRSSVINNNDEPGVGAGWDDISTPLNPAPVASSYSNLRASATGLNATVSITADAINVRSSTGSIMLSSVSVSPSLSASGVNGLDSGTSSASTWYSLWVIWNGTTAAGLLSLSATAPTLPAGYTHKARVGWIRTDATANKYPLSFVKIGRRAQYKISTGSNVLNYPVMASGINGSLGVPTWAAVSVSPFTPPTAAAVSVTASIPPNSSSSLAVNPNNAVGAMNSAANRPVLLASNTTTTATYGSTASASILLESSNIYVAMDSAGQLVQCTGWEDNL